MNSETQNSVRQLINPHRNDSTAGSLASRIPQPPTRGSDHLLDQLLTVDEAAQRLNTTPRFIRRLIEERRIPFHKLGRHVRIDTEDLTAYVNANRIAPARRFGNQREAA